MARLKVYLLGPPRIEIDGKLVQFDTRKAEALLAYLVVTGESHRRDALAVLLWPENDTSGARAALRRTLSVLRKGIGDDFWEVSYENIGLKNHSPIWVDLSVFQQLLRDVEKHSHPMDQICDECLASLEQAADLYRGDFMAGFGLRDSAAFDDWQFFQADDLRRDLAGALDLLVQAYTTRSEHERAIASAHRWLALDPLREEVHTQLMRLYTWAGQRNAALRQYRECVRILEQELGVPPLDETTQVYQQILNNQLAPLFNAQARRLAESPVIPLAHTVHEIHDVPVLEVTALPDLVLPFVGRDDEWDTLCLCHSSAKRDGWVALIEGEAGIGKTRLSEEFISLAKSQGAQVFQARCYEGETNLAFAPFMAGLGSLLKSESAAGRLGKVPNSWLVETARLQSELYSLLADLPGPAPLDSPGGQSRFFEGVRRTLIALLTGPVAGVLMLDDLQWADEASLELLAYILRRLEGSGLFILLTWRGEGTRDNAKVMQIIAEAQRRKRCTRLRLERLGVVEIDKLVMALPDQTTRIDAQFSQRLFRESEGLPLYAVSYLNSIHQPQAHKPEMPIELPGDIWNLWQVKMSVLDEVAQQLLDTAAVIGRSFGYLLLKDASGRGEIETVSGLEHLLTEGLVIENRQVASSDDLQYDFTHEKLREMVYQTMSLARRRLLHRRIAEVLLNLARGRREAGLVTALVADHFQQAGMTGQAAEYYKLAGEQARTLYANATALAHFQSALAAGHPETTELHEDVGDLYVLLGKYGEAMQSYETATALCAVPDLARLEHKLGEVQARKGDWALAQCYFQLAMGDLPEKGEAALRAMILADWSMAAHRLGEAAQAADLAYQSNHVADETRDIHALSQAHNLLGMLARARGDYTEAIQWLNSSLQNARELGEPGRQAAALNNLALVHRDNQDLEEALNLCQAALGLCSEQGDRHREAALLNNYADLLHKAGRTIEAMEYLRKAVVIFAEIGVQAGEQEPEIWKLTEW